MPKNKLQLLGDKEKRRVERYMQLCKSPTSSVRRIKNKQLRHRVFALMHREPWAGLTTWEQVKLLGKYYGVKDFKSTNGKWSVELFTRCLIEADRMERGVQTDTLELVNQFNRSTDTRNGLPMRVGDNQPSDDIREKMTGGRKSTGTDTDGSDRSDMCDRAGVHSALDSSGCSANARQVGGGHYGGGDRQHWDIVAEHGLDYFQGQITKYVMRWNKKNGIEDLRKAQHFLEKYIELAEKGGIGEQSIPRTD